MAIFAARDTNTTEISDWFKDHEIENCEHTTSMATVEYYDSVYTCNWSETKDEAAKGWHIKKELLSLRPPAKKKDISFPGFFIVHGRLMFGNHDKEAPFYFKEFVPKTPKGKNGRLTGRLTIAPHNKKIVVDIKRGQEILIHYDFDMEFGDEPALRLQPVEEETASTDPVEVEMQSECERPRLSAAQEIEMVMKETLDHQDDPNDRDFDFDGVGKVSTVRG